MEAQRDMAWTQCDVARFFYLLLGRFASFGLVPRRVGGPTRHGGVPMRHGVLVLRPFWVFWCLWARAMSCWRPNTTWRAPNTTWRALLLPFGLFWRLWGGATSFWRPNASWRTPNATWKGTIQCDAPLSGHFNKKSHLRTKSEVAGLMLIWFLVCLTCQLGH